MNAAETIESLAREFVQAWARSDVATLDGLLAKRYTHTDINGRVWDRPNWLDYAAGPRSVVAVSSEDMEVFVRGDVAVVTGRNVAQFGGDDGPGSAGEHALRFTQVWVREGTGWKRAYFQATSEENY